VRLSDGFPRPLHGEDASPCRDCDVSTAPLREFAASGAAADSRTRARPSLRDRQDHARADPGAGDSDHLGGEGEPDLDDAIVRAREERAVLDLLRDEDLPGA
jgi:hypothetical protein